MYSSIYKYVVSRWCGNMSSGILLAVLHGYFLLDYLTGLIILNEYIICAWIIITLDLPQILFFILHISLQLPSIHIIIHTNISEVNEINVTEKTIQLPYENT